ncbi:hypothetical protein AALP_AAs65055U000100, partial [Arabis alpina]
YATLRPEFSMGKHEKPGGHTEYSCRLQLPCNAPFKIPEGPVCSSMRLVQQAVCLAACKKLHEMRAFTDMLLPDKGTGQDVEKADQDDEGEHAPGTARHREFRVLSMSMDLYVARAMITQASLAFRGSLDVTESQLSSLKKYHRARPDVYLGTNERTLGGDRREYGFGKLRQNIVSGQKSHPTYGIRGAVASFDVVRASGLVPVRDAMEMVVEGDLSQGKLMMADGCMVAKVYNNSPCFSGWAALCKRHKLNVGLIRVDLTGNSLQKKAGSLRTMRIDLEAEES